MPDTNPSPRVPRILFAAMQTRNFSNGGVESATRIFEALRARYQWALLTTREMPRLQRWRRGGARVIIAPFDETASRFLRRLAGLLWSLRFVREIQTFEPDIVHCNDIQSYQAYSFIPRMFRQAPLLFTLRDTRTPGSKPGPIWHKLVDQATIIVVLSKEMGENLSTDIPAARPKLKVINSIVDLKQFQPTCADEKAAARRRLGIADAQYAVGCIGAIGEKKGQRLLLLDTLPELARSCADAHLHLIGDCDPASGAYVSDTVDVALNSPFADRVTLHGHSDAMSDWYKALDVICIAANHEGLARAMIEGMASGLPIVSTAVCSADEMLAETGAGLVVPIGDSIALADALLQYHDEKLRTLAGRKGRKVAESRFSEESLSAEWRSVYRLAAAINENSG
ncbi:glycosyltransferase family 4 protein [Pseudopontixanthobacter vadosimaris]|uniref:glycosyltransferase family 4 protein n=1 Tax=Pseudopontixanthobacter vadosimaris TaxID=2726450 RepID=UPI0014767A99|nr:glycosyltransferase family 4 protein [Pseudopontixanthobacter vadosimaris]